MESIFYLLDINCRYHLLFLEHLNYLGMDERFGPVALSLKREKLDENTSLLKGGEAEGNQYQYRIIARTSEVCKEELLHVAL